MWNLAGRSMVYMIDGSYRFAAACARDHMFFLPRLAEVAGWLFDQGFAFYILRNGAIRVKIIHYRFVYRGDVEMKRWIIPPVDKQQAQQTAREFGMDAFGALLLLSRGITEEPQIEEFLSEDLILQNPYALPDMEQAVHRVRQALEVGETIGIFGDYDADGITSTALLTDCLRRAGAHVVYRLPDREAGYGISREAADAFKAAGVSLIITVDNGITAVEEAAYIRLLEMDLVITDHHLPGETLPQAVAVVDPHRADSPAEFSDYAGVGVAFMLACAVTDTPPEELLYVYGDLVALGTIADVVPLLGDNRSIVRGGLQMLRQTRRPGLIALLAAAGLQAAQISAHSVAFGLAPRINAAGRIGDPVLALELLLCDDMATAEHKAVELCEYNDRRKALETEILQQARQQILADDRLYYAPVLTVCGEGWHHGVLGIVAARLVQQFGRPVLVCARDGDQITGSARSYKGVSIYEILKAASAHLTRFGGHEAAAGCSMTAQAYPAAVEAMQDAVLQLYGALPLQELTLSCKLNPRGMSVGTVYAAQYLEPCGCMNEPPVYGLFRMKITNITPVGNGKHLRLSLFRDGVGVTAMLFSTTPDTFVYRVGDVADFAVTLDINRYNGAESLSVIVRDLHPCTVDYERLQIDVGAYLNYRALGILPQVEPVTREEIAAVYRAVKARQRVCGEPDVLCARFGTGNYLKLRLILDILAELELIRLTDRQGITVEYIPNAARRELIDSHILQKINGKEVQG